MKSSSCEKRNSHHMFVANLHRAATTPQWQGDSGMSTLGASSWSHGTQQPG